MDGIKNYLITILTAAIICSIVAKLSNSKTMTSRIIKLITGLFLSITIVTPVLKIQIGEISSYFNDLESSADEIITSGESSAKNELKENILQKTEAYILDKASSYGATIRVSAEISDMDAIIPDSVTLEGNISPYVRQQLQKTISEELGIPEDNQVWILN